MAKDASKDQGKSQSGQRSPEAMALQSRLNEGGTRARGGSTAPGERDEQGHPMTGAVRLHRELPTTASAADEGVEADVAAVGDAPFHRPWGSPPQNIDTQTGKPIDTEGEPISEVKPKGESDFQKFERGRMAQMQSDRDKGPQPTRTVPAAAPGAAQR